MTQDTHITRRELLGKTGKAVIGAGLTAAIPAFLPKGARGAAAPSERIRLGFIGMGGQGNNNLGELLPHVVAVCDVDSKRLSAGKARVEKANGKSCAAYGDYRKLLERKDIDGVVISTPDHWHALQCIHACQAGKDVYVEKPVSLTIAEGRAMVHAARRHHRIVQAGSQQRSHKEFLHACELARNGYLGKISSVKVGLPKVNFNGPTVPDTPPPPELNYGFWLGPAPERPYNPKHVHYNFRFFWDYSGGQLTNWGAHHLDIAQWGLGMDESGPVYAQGSGEYQPQGWYEVPNTFHVAYTYANGITVYCGTELRQGVTFEGDRGSVWVDRGRIETNPPELLRQPLDHAKVPLYPSDNHHANWLECIKTRRPPIADIEIGHRSATVCHLGNLTIRANRLITWDPITEKITGEPELAALTSHPYRAPWKLPRNG